jgi:hypothetical protein
MAMVMGEAVEFAGGRISFQYFVTFLRSIFNDSV